MRVRALLAAPLLALLVSGCTNNPYPAADSEHKVLYKSYRDAPRTLDPAVAYTTNAHAITGEIYETLLEYHYLKRPYELIPSLERALPELRDLGDGFITYRFLLREGLIYQDDPCFELDGAGRRTREVVMADLVFEFMRLADPATNSPIVEPMSNIRGFREFSQRLAELRAAPPEPAATEPVAATPDPAPPVAAEPAPAAAEFLRGEFSGLFFERFRKLPAGR